MYREDCDQVFEGLKPFYLKSCFIADFKKKVELFNCFFSKQCSLIANYSEIPTILSSRTYKRLSTVTLSAKDIEKIIQGLDPNKGYGNDNISIRMLKMCSDIICKPLEIILSQDLTSGSFPSEWEKGNIVPIHRNMINKTYKTIAQSPYFLFMVKFSKDLCLTKCLGLLGKTNLLHLTDLIFNRMIPASVMNYLRNL